MGMGTYACHADTVKDEFVREVCPYEMAELQSQLDNAELDWYGLAACTDRIDEAEEELAMEISEERASLIIKAYDTLFQAFQKKTGLDLQLKYHDKEDRGDEVDGHFWAVDGVYILSPAGEKYKDEIERKFWTTWG
tara:strand:+ start:30195 stop:30602 length:408 start_codon:yes stop_codon:yes gene_type:complete